MLHRSPSSSALRVRRHRKDHALARTLLKRHSRKAAHRDDQRRYEARLRDGIGLYPVPLGCHEIDLLIALRWLPEGQEANRERVGDAVANVLRELGRAVRADR